MTAHFKGRLRFAVDFRPPPADAYEQEAPVVEEFRRFAFEGVTDELEYPSEEKEGERVDPEAVEEERRDGHSQRDEDGWNA